MLKKLGGLTFKLHISCIFFNIFNCPYNSEMCSVICGVLPPILSRRSFKLNHIDPNLFKGRVKRGSEASILNNIDESIKYSDILSQ